jgi:hypothetical protein
VIAAAVADHFESQHADVYQEVTSPLAPADSTRTDLVAVAGDLVHIVECKVELSFELLAQARYWDLHEFGCVWIAVPKLHRKTVGRTEALRVARSFYGFGVFVVDDAAIVLCEPARLRPPTDRRLLEALRPEHKTHAVAGSPAGGHFTSFKASCAALRAYVEQNDGCRLVEAVQAIQHHYRSNESAVSSLGHWVREGKVAGVYIGWKGRLYNSERTSALSRRSA